MQTEFPRNAIPSEQAGAMSSGSDCASAASETAPLDLTDDELALIDLRYRQFVALAELDHLMDDL